MTENKELSSRVKINHRKITNASTSKNVDDTTVFKVVKEDETTIKNWSNSSNLKWTEHISKLLRHTNINNPTHKLQNVLPPKHKSVYQPRSYRMFECFETNTDCILPNLLNHAIKLRGFKVDFKYSGL